MLCHLHGSNLESFHSIKKRGSVIVPSTMDFKCFMESGFLSFSLDGTGYAFDFIIGNNSDNQAY